MSEPLVKKVSARSRKVEADVVQLPPSEETLTSLSLQGLTKQLPQPCATETLDGVQFNLYRVKSLFSPEWSNPILHRLLEEARKSYKIYGPVPELDRYDPKSAIYLTHASYLLRTVEGKEIPVEEWSSLRFVPASGKPPSNEDLDFYVHRKGDKQQPILSLMRQRLKVLKRVSEKEANQRIVAQSRFCAIRPYAARKSDQYLIEQHQRGNPRSGGNLHSALSFALMNKQFLEDIQRKGASVQIITCQMHLNLSDFILSFPPYSRDKTMPFTYAYQELGLKNSDSICLNRTNPKVYAYRHPGYFLNLNDLTQTLNSLIKKNQLSEDILQSYLPPRVTWSQVKTKPRFPYFQRIGELLTIKGKIPGTKMRGEELRVILDKEVRDGAIWRIMKAQEWQVGVKKMIDSAREA